MMNEKFWRNIIKFITINNYNTKDIVFGQELYGMFKLSFSVLSLCLGILGTITFGTLTYLQGGNLFTLIFEYILVVILLLALTNIKHNRDYRINGVLIPMIVYGLLFCYLWFDGSDYNSKGIWIIILPVVNIFLGGTRIGIAFTIAEYIFVAAVALIPSFGYDNYGLNAFIRYSGVYWTVALLTFVFEFIREKAEKSIDFLNRVIADKRELEIKEEFLERYMGIYNRSGFLALGDVVWKQAIRDKNSVSILMVDVDNFTELNKQYGYWTCDDILKQIAHIIQENVRRPLDIIGRYQSNIYSIQLYGTNANAALSIAKRISDQIVEFKFEHKGFIINMPISVSIGVASLDNIDLESSLESLISLAQRNLEKAKLKGCNGVYINESENPL